MKIRNCNGFKKIVYDKYKDMMITHLSVWLHDGNRIKTNISMLYIFRNRTREVH